MDFGFRPALAQTTFDPLAIGVGARALGMGNAYVAVADDGDAIFTNPAGLGEIDTFQFTSMGGTVMEDVNYSVLGAVYPLGDRGAAGIGLASAGVGGIDIRSIDGTLISTSNYENLALLLAYGKKITEKISMGIILKYFLQTGSAVSGSEGSGANLDIGFLQSGLGFLSVGAVGRNILGEENAPRSLKVGARMHLLGEKFRAARLSPLELSLAADADLGLEAWQPVTTNIGVELSPADGITLRCGVDRDSATFGFSSRFAGVGFTYAFHPYSEARLETHFFSLSFSERGWPSEEPPDVFLGMD